MEQRFQFDEIATLYEAARPGYPDALIEDVVSHADLKLNDRILEVGCGTGQATKSFARQGFPILAIEPGPELIRGARRSLAGFSNVSFLETTFEAYPARAEAFRLIVAAQSWHWVSPETRFQKAAEGALIARVTRSFRTCPGGPARPAARSIQGNLPASNGPVGSPAGGLVPARWSVQRMV